MRAATANISGPASLCRPVQRSLSGVPGRGQLLSPRRAGYSSAAPFLHVARRNGCAHCSEGCENAATSESPEQANFGGFTFYEVRCISLVSASKKKPMEKESALFTMDVSS